MKKLVKKFYPITAIVIFGLLIKLYFDNNADDFSFVKKIKIETVFIIIILSFFYLITEGMLLKKLFHILEKKHLY